MPFPSILSLALAAAAAGAMLSPRQDPDGARKTDLGAELLAMSEKAPLTVAHRGASGDYPENTLPALHAGVAAGAPIIELDFHQTADGELVVLHDEVLDRTTNSEQVFARQGVAIGTVTLEQVQRLDAGSWKHERFSGTDIPTLRQALAEIGEKAYVIAEHKSGDPERVATLLRDANLFDRVMVQSFDLDWLQRLHEVEKRITTVAAGEHPINANALADLPRTGAGVVHWDGAILRTEDVTELHRRGYVVFAYTLNTDLAMLGGGRIDLDGITTDRPARLLELTSRGLLARPR